MNAKITFPELIEAVATSTNTSKRISETFLKEFFALISDSLAKDESVKIKRIGTFKLTAVDARKSVNVNTGEEIEIPAHKRIVYTPDKELAEAINMPFANFETIELSDNIPDSELVKLEDTGEAKEDIAPENEEVDIEKEKKDVNVDQVHEDDKKDQEDIVVEPTTTNFIACEERETVEEESVIDENKEVEETKSSFVENSRISKRPSYIDEIQIKEIKKSAFGKGFIYGCVSSALCATIIVIFIISQLNGFSLISAGEDKKVEDKKETPVVIPTPLIKPIAKQEVVVMDTITSKNFLTSMARKYYGDNNYWVYIYEENIAILDNPNKIEPGTAVIIPDAKKYGIDRNNPESLNEAKKKAYIIFKRFE